MRTYNPSSLTDNYTLLQEMIKITKYLKENPIYKCYFSSASYVAGTTTYLLSTVTTRSETVTKGDVIFFGNNYYGVIASIGDTTFTVTSASYFKGDTGATGSQGPQGATGATGATGADVLMNRGWESSSAPEIGDEIEYTTAYLSRDPQAYDTMVMLWIDTTNDKSYLVNCNYVSTTGTKSKFTIDKIGEVTGPQGPQGTQGATGPQGLQGPIGPTGMDVVTTTGTIIVGTNSIAISRFSRTPLINDKIAIYSTDTDKTYCAIGIVLAILNDNVTVMVSSVTELDGGPSGLTGLSCHLLDMPEYSSIADIPSSITVGSGAFNRDPQYLEKCIVFIRPLNGLVVCEGTISNIESDVITMTLSYRTDIIGPAGSSVIIQSASSTTEEGKSVPVLSAVQVTNVYNSFIAGNHVLIVSADETKEFSVVEVHADSSSISIFIIFDKDMILEYTLEDNTVTIYSQTFSGGGGGGASLNKYTYSFTSSNFDFTRIGNICKNAKGRISLNAMDYYESTSQGYMEQNGTVIMATFIIDIIGEDVGRFVIGFMDGACMAKMIMWGESGNSISDVTEELTNMTITYFNDTEITE